MRGLPEWALLGSNQPRRRCTLCRSEPESACLQALLEGSRRADFGPEPLFGVSRVVNRWSAGVAHAVNADFSRTYGCICVSAPVGFGVWVLC